MKKIYAKAIEQLVQKNSHTEAEVATLLLEHLRKSGRLKLLTGIQAELKILAKRKENTSSTHLEVARSAEREYALLEAQNVGMETKEVIITPSLISGFRVRKGGFLIDHSGKRALVDMYRAVTNYQ